MNIPTSANTDGTYSDLTSSYLKNMGNPSQGKNKPVAWNTGPAPGDRMTISPEARAAGGSSGGAAPSNATSYEGSRGYKLYSGKPKWNTGNKITFQVDTKMGSRGISMTQAAMSEFNAVSGSTLKLGISGQFAETAGQDTSLRNNGRNDLWFVTDGGEISRLGLSGHGGRSFFRYDANKKMIESDVVINARDVNWSDKDLKTILMHELGHSIGLDHQSGAIMDAGSFIFNLNGKFTQDDINGILALYKNGTTTQNTSQSDMVKRLYSVVLGRSADTDGLNNWTNNTTTKGSQSTVSGFFTSSEYSKKINDYNLFVNNMYKAILGRSPDASGLAYWKGQLDGGAMSKSDVINGFLASPEFSTVDPFQSGSGTKAEVDTAVKRVYDVVLQRSPDQAGLDYWTNQSMAQKGLSSVVRGFALSEEFTARVHDYDKLVKDLYTTTLNRSADSAGLANWKGKLNSGAMTASQVITSFVNSPEFKTL